MCLAVAFASCAGSGAAGDEAEQVAVKWLKAMAASDAKSACQLMDAENHRRYSEYPSWSPAKSCQEKWLHSDNTPLDWKPKPDALFAWGEAHPKVFEVKVYGNRATVVVGAAGNAGQPVRLRKEGGRWLVDGTEYPI